MNVAEAAIILRRKVRYLQTRDESNRSHTALAHDREEIEALEIALGLLAAQDSPFDPAKALQQVLDEIDAMELGYGIETQQLWKLVAYGRVVLDQLGR